MLKAGISGVQPSFFGGPTSNIVMRKTGQTLRQNVVVNNSTIDIQVDNPRVDSIEDCLQLLLLFYSLRLGRFLSLLSIRP